MKILHTSDWHLGITFRGRSAEEDQWHFIDQICDILTSRKIDAMILAGDVFDRSIASTEAISLYDRVMTRIAGELRVPVLCIAGNHDSAERLSQCSELLRRSGLYIAGALTKEPCAVSFEDADIYLLPWFSIEKARAVFPGDADRIRSMEDAYRVVCGELRQTFAPGKKHILVSHAFITNAETSTSDRAAEIGFATQVNMGVFEGFDYVALGHIHKPQEVAAAIRYSGSPMPYSFGKEEKQKKGVVILDTEDMSQEFVELKPLHARTTLKGGYDTLLNTDYGEDVRNGYVRLEVTDSYVGLEAMALFNERFPNLIEVKGKDLDREDASITMSIEEFEKRVDDPVSVFRSYCEDILRAPAEEARLGRFSAAVENYMKEEQ